MSLNPYKEEVLFDFIHKLRGFVRAPMPRRIEIDCGVKASSTLDIGVISFFEEDLVLKFGLPLVAGLTARQFAGLLAHELGHFSQVTGRRFPIIITSMMHCFRILSMSVIYGTRNLKNGPKVRILFSVPSLILLAFLSG